MPKPPKPPCKSFPRVACNCIGTRRALGLWLLILWGASIGIVSPGAVISIYVGGVAQMWFVFFFFFVFFGALGLVGRWGIFRYFEGRWLNGPNPLCMPPVSPHENPFRGGSLQAFFAVRAVACFWVPSHGCHGWPKPLPPHNCRSPGGGRWFHPKPMVLFATARNRRGQGWRVVTFGPPFSPSGCCIWSKKGPFAFSARPSFLRNPFGGPNVAPPQLSTPCRLGAFVGAQPFALFRFFCAPAGWFLRLEASCRVLFFCSQGAPLGSHSCAVCSGRVALRLVPPWGSCLACLSPVHPGGPKVAFQRLAPP